MWDVILEALIDALKVLPVLFLVYLLIEFLEHKKKIQFENFVVKSKKTGPLWGSAMGCIPQCGFSAVFSDLFSRKMVTIGTLFAVFISTSDEALPILFAHLDKWASILILVVSKFILAVIIGFIIDLIFRKQKTVVQDIDDHEHDEKCTHDHCCADNIFIGALKHTAEIFAYILIANLLINIVVYFIGEESLTNILAGNTIFQPIIATLIGLIPNCVSSVLLTELYLAGSLSLASVIAGLSAGTGVGIIILFKKNKNIKQNISIVVSLFLIASIIGLILNLFLPFSL